MGDLNVDSARAAQQIYTQPTDPDTLKIVAKIKQDYVETTTPFTDPARLEEARKSLEQSIGRRLSDPDRRFVRNAIITEPEDRRVLGLAKQIETTPQKATGDAALAKRTKWQTQSGG